MVKSTFLATCVAVLISTGGRGYAQTGTDAGTDMEATSHTLYDIAPRQLVDLPTAGTLPRGNYQIGLRLYSDGGAMGNTDIGLSSRFQLGISFGGTQIVSDREPNWNPHMGFSLKFRIIDELEYFPAISIGYTDQGYGVFNAKYNRYTFKSRGFYAVASHNFYFYKWTSGWHGGINYSREDEGDGDHDFDLFAGFDATFNYNMALLLEYDAGLNDDRGERPDISGKGRGYLNTSIKWLFAQNLELEVLIKDLLVNRREAKTVTREVRMMYIDHF